MSEEAVRLVLPCADEEFWDFYGDEFPYDRIPSKPQHFDFTRKNFADDASLPRLARLRDSLAGSRKVPRITAVVSQYDDSPVADMIMMGLCKADTFRLNANPEHPYGCNPLWVCPTVGMYGLSWEDRSAKHLTRRTITQESYIPWVIIGPILEGHSDEIMWISRDLYRRFHRHKKIIVRLVSDDPAPMLRKIFRLSSVPTITVAD